MTSRPAIFLVYANAFVIGAVLMGFEMLGSRYLYPYFGGGIGTWSGLISTVLCALAFGYFIGGAVADKSLSGRSMSGPIALAAAYLCLIPAAADPLMTIVLNGVGDGAFGVVVAAMILLLIPLSLLGMLSPMIIKLLSSSTEEAGRIAGRVYGVSTLGNVFGTMFTTFVLIPVMGSRAITYLFAAILLASAASLFLLPRKSARDA